MRLALVSFLICAACKDPASRAAPPAQAGIAVAEVSITSNGFEPARVQAAPGKPVILRFTRKVAETCADAVEIQGDPVRHMLPLGAPVDVKVTAPASGELAFACPMNMYRGAVVVGQ
jgi:plastocyanin domain-containing protein